MNIRKLLLIISFTGTGIAGNLFALEDLILRHDDLVYKIVNKQEFDPLYPRTFVDYNGNRYIIKNWAYEQTNDQTKLGYELKRQIFPNFFKEETVTFQDEFGGYLNINDQIKHFTEQNSKDKFKISRKIDWREVGAAGVLSVLFVAFSKFAWIYAGMTSNVKY